jgi:hypothetical protein
MARKTTVYFKDTRELVVIVAGENKRIWRETYSSMALTTSDQNGVITTTLYPWHRVWRVIYES